MFTLRTGAAFVFVLAAIPLAAQKPTAPVPTTARTTTPTRLLPGTRGDVLATIQGNALTSTNGQLADAPMRLRDARSGRIVDTQVSDKAGLFTFEGVEPGSYVVEVLGPDASTVLTASQILTVDAGQVISAIVKLPFRIPPFAGMAAGQAVSTGSIAALAAQAASSGIVAMTATGAPTCALQ